MTDQTAPQYRFRGSVVPSAEIARPVAVVKNATGGDDKAPTSATLDIFDVIDSYGGWWGISARDVDAAIKQVGDVDTLYVRINSPGGEATEGVAIANLLRATRATVRVTVYGLAASAASMIAVSGDFVSMAPGSMLMVHDAWDFAMGAADDLRKSATVLDAISDSYAGLYAAKAGGTTDEWRAVMRDTVWYGADAAVKAKLADQVGLDPTLPNNLPPVEDTDDDDATVIVLDVQVNPAARAAARRFDLSMLPNAPAALTKAPADQPVTPNKPKEADIMSDIPTAGLVKALGLADDADEDAILEAVEARITASAATPKVTDEAVAAAYGIEPGQVKAALDAAKAGKVSVSQSYLDTIEGNAKLGAEARAKQLADDRDDAINDKVAKGIISRDQVESWQRDWDRDPASAKAELDKLTVARFPVGDAPGVAGSAESGVGSYTDEMASQDAELFGLPKEAFAR